MIQNDKLQKNLLLKKEQEWINLKPLNVKHKTQPWRSCLGNVSLTPRESKVRLFCFSVYLHTRWVQRYDPHAVPADSPLSLSGRTCTCRWILLHSGIHFNHMICFCFLSSRCHDNLVYGCPGQQVKHRTPKQKGEFPIPSKQERFASAQEKQHASEKKKEKKCGGEITHVHVHSHRQTNGLSHILTPHISVRTYTTNTVVYRKIYYPQSFI